MQPLGLVDCDVDVAHEPIGWSEVAFGHSDRSEGEAAVRVITEALLYSAFLVSRQVQFGTYPCSGTQHGDVGPAQLGILAVCQIAAREKELGGVRRLKHGESQSLGG